MKKWILRGLLLLLFVGIVWVVNLGMIKILQFRDKAMNQLGDQFDIKEFHDVVLGNGALPLEILERLVDKYIHEKKNA